MTLHFQLTMSTEQWCAGATDGISGRHRRSYAWLVPPTASPEPHGERGSQMQNSVNTMPLETRDCTLTLCSRICAANSAHLFQEEYPERKAKYLIPINRALQRSMRKDTVRLFLKKVYLLSRLSFFLPFLLKKRGGGAGRHLW